MRERTRASLKPLVLVATLTVLCAGFASAAERQIIRPKGTAPGGNYSPGILVDGTLYISGQAGEDTDGKVPATFEAEVKQALDNIGTVLEAAGMSPTDVVSVQQLLGSPKGCVVDT